MIYFILYIYLKICKKKLETNLKIHNSVGTDKVKVEN